MLYDGKQIEFESELHRAIWARGRAVVPFELSTADITDRELLDGFKQVYDFTVALFAELYACPEKYELQMGGEIQIHLYLCELIKYAKANGLEAEWIMKEVEMPPRALKALKKIDLLRSFGFVYERDNGTIKIKSEKYPLFLKYFAVLHEESLKRRLFCINYVTACDFRIFNNYIKSIDDIIRVLSDKEKAYVLKIHNDLIEKGCTPKSRPTGDDVVIYKYKKQDLMSIALAYSKKLVISVSLGENMDNEIAKLPNKDEMMAYVSESICYCTLCNGYRNKPCIEMHKSCNSVYWTDLDGKKRLTCGMPTLSRRYEIIDQYNEYEEHEIKTLKLFLDLRTKVIEIK